MAFVQAASPSMYPSTLLTMPMPLNLIEALVDIGVEEAGAPLPSRSSLELLSNAAFTAARSASGDVVATASQGHATRALTRMLERFAVIWEDYCKELAAGLDELHHQTSTASTTASKDIPPYFYDSGLNYDKTSPLGPLTATTAEPPTPEGSLQEPASRRAKGFSTSSSPNFKSSLSSVPSSSTLHAATPFNTLPQHLVDPKDWCTVILRNIPNKYDEIMLVEQFNASGFSTDSHIRYVYTPKDGTNNCNLGYAFVDLVNHDEAVRFTSVYEGFRLPSSKSRKVCSANWAKMQSVPASLQGSVCGRMGSALSTVRRDGGRALSGSTRKASTNMATPRRFSKRHDNTGTSTTPDRSLKEITLVGLPSRRCRGHMVDLLSSRFGSVVSCVVDDDKECRVTLESSAVAFSVREAILSGSLKVDGQVLRLADREADRGYYEDDGSDLQFNVGPLDDYLTQ